MQFKIMEDTVTPGQISGDPWGVAGYRRGLFPDAFQLAHIFPHAEHCFIAIHDGGLEVEDCDAIDNENGDATTAEAAVALGQLPHPHTTKPLGYTFAANSQELINEAEREGHHRDSWFLWSAHIGRGEHICAPDVCGFPKADLTQYTFTFNNRNIDGSMVPAHGIFKDTVKPVLPPDPHHYRWYASSKKGEHGIPGGPFHFIVHGQHIEVDERATVKRYDELRRLQTHVLHPHRAEIDALKAKCRLLYERIDAVVEEQTIHGVAPWHDFRRFAFRKTHLKRRALGGKVA